MDPWRPIQFMQGRSLVAPAMQSRSSAVDSPVAATPEVRALLANDCVVAIGVSGVPAPLPPHAIWTKLATPAPACWFMPISADRGSQPAAGRDSRAH